MTREIELRLQEAGTYHVVAISGGNIALLAAAVLTLLWAIRLRFAAGAVVAVVVLAAHGWVIGGGPSVMRATLTAIVYLALRVIDQRTAPVNAIGVGASLMLLANPLDIVNAGFWLTFGASGALLAAAARWQPARPVSWWHACGGYLCWQPRGGTGPHAGIGPGVRACDDGRIGAEPGRGPGDGRGAGSGVCLRDGRRDRHRVSRGRGGLGHVWRGSRAGGQQPAGGPGAVGHLAGPGAVTLADGRVLRVARRHGGG